MKYLVMFEHGELNYSAYVPDVPGCITVGDTLEETRKEIRDAIEFHLECLVEQGDPIPLPETELSEMISDGVIAEYVNVDLTDMAMHVAKMFVVENETELLTLTGNDLREKVKDFGTNNALNIAASIADTDIWTYVNSIDDDEYINRTALNLCQLLSNDDFVNQVVTLAKET